MSCRETQWARFRRSSSTVERTVNPCLHIFRNHGGAQRNQTLSPLPVPAHTAGAHYEPDFCSRSSPSFRVRVR